MRALIKKQRQRRSPSRKTEVRMTTYYRSGEKSEKSSPFTKRPQKRAYKNFFLTSADTLVIVALFLLIVYSLLLNTTPAVKASNASYRPIKDYQQFISKQLGSPKNRNKVTFDEQAISKSLKIQFPEVSGVNIELPIFSQTPTFRLNVAQPSFILNSAGHLYVVGSSGRAIMRADGFSNLSSLAVVNDETGYRSILGKQVMSKEGVAFLNNLLAQSKKNNVPISAITIPPRAQELHVRTADRNYYVKFFLGGDSNTQIGQFIASRSYFDSHGPQPSEYLDVRVPGKVYSR